MRILKGNPVSGCRPGKVYGLKPKADVHESYFEAGKENFSGSTRKP